MQVVNNQTASSCTTPLSTFSWRMNACSDFITISISDGFGRVWPAFLPGARIFLACQLARGGFFRHHFAFPDRWNIDLRQTWDYCNISSHFDNSLFRLPGGLHSKCSERCQTNYGSDFLFRILQLWFQNLLALVTRYLESTFRPRFACIPGSLKCERGAQAPGRPRHNMDHISTPQHALFSPPPLLLLPGW